MSSSRISYLFPFLVSIHSFCIPSPPYLKVACFVTWGWSLWVSFGHLISCFLMHVCLYVSCVCPLCFIYNDFFLFGTERWRRATTKSSISLMYLHLCNYLDSNSSSMCLLLQLSPSLYPLITFSNWTICAHDVIWSILFSWGFNASLPFHPHVLIWWFRKFLSLLPWSH